MMKSFIFFRIVSVFSGNTNYPLCFTKGLGRLGTDLLFQQSRGFGDPDELTSWPGEPAGGSSKVGEAVRRNGGRLLGVRFGDIQSSGTLARKARREQQLSTMEMGNDRLLVTNLQTNFSNLLII